MNKLFFVLTLLALVSGVVGGGVSAKASTKVPTDWSKMTGASVLLSAAADGSQPSPLFCSFEPDDARELRAKLEKKIEMTMKTWVAAHKHAETYADPSWPVSCQQTCSCGLDASLLEHVGLARLGTQDRWVFRRVSTLALEQTPSATKECASRQTWFCESSMLKQLRRSK